MGFNTRIQVRFCETDAFGHVNNISYFIYFEQARADMLSNLGLMKNEEHFVLASIQCDYKEQAFYRQVLEIDTVVKKVGSKSVVLEHQIRDAETGKQVATGKDILVNFDPKAQKSIEMSEEARKKLGKYVQYNMA